MSELSIWTEKYRPKKLDEVVAQQHVVERLKAWVKEKSIPNLLFAGSAGVGKTTTALALARELFGDKWNENFLETNASDERGIDVVRGKIKEFARIKPIGHDFKIIFLDEADALTSEAQQALRRTMEKYSGACRFILSCNYSSRLIDPIQSRCVVFRFKGLTKIDVENYMKKIAQNEKLQIDQLGLDAIYEVSEGDMRKATNLLQACSVYEKITPEIVYSVSASAKPKDVRAMLDLAVSGNFPEAKKKLYDMLINQGISAEDIIKETHRNIFDLQIPEEKKLKLIEKIGEYEFRLNQGGTPEIQLTALLTNFLQ